MYQERIFVVSNRVTGLIAYRLYSVQSRSSNFIFSVTINVTGCLTGSSVLKDV